MNIYGNEKVDEKVKLDSKLRTVYYEVTRCGHLNHIEMFGSLRLGVVRS